MNMQEKGDNSRVDPTSKQTRRRGGKNKVGFLLSLFIMHGG